MGLIRLVYRLRVDETLTPWFAIKSSLAGGLIYYTIEEGLWSRSEESIKFYHKLVNAKDQVLQNYSSLNQLISAATPDPALTESLRSKLPKRGLYEQAVLSSTEFLANIPTHVSSAVDTISNNLSSVKD